MVGGHMGVGLMSLGSDLGSSFSFIEMQNKCIKFLTNMSHSVV